MECVVNIIELASELADDAMKRELCGTDIIEDYSENWYKIYVEENDIVSYTEPAQDCFNNWYDYYFNIILKYGES